MEFTAWWTDPKTFRERQAAFARDRKRIGDSDLPPTVRQYLHKAEEAEWREQSDIPRPKQR